MRTPKIGVRLQNALNKYAEFIADYYVEDDWYGASEDDSNIYSIWIHMKSDHFDAVNETTIVHEDNQTTAVRELNYMVDLIKSRVSTGSFERTKLINTALGEIYEEPCSKVRQ